MNASKKPFFTIGIPTYNRSNFLALAIESVLKQDFGDYEIVVSDNNSTDNTQELIKKFQKKTNKIRYYKLPKNIPAQRNVMNCYFQARGKYFFNLFDDDLILKADTLSYLYKIAIKYSPGLMKIGALFYYEKYESIKDIYKGFLFKEPLVLIKKNDSDFVKKISGVSLEFGSGTVVMLDKKKLKLLNGDDVLYYNLAYQYSLVSNYGAAVIGDHYILGRFFSSGHFIYDFLEPAFSLDTQLDISKKYIRDKKHYDVFANQMRRSWLLSIINLRISIPTNMLFRCILKIIKRDNYLLINLPYYFLSLTSLITPKILLLIIKKQYVKKLTSDALMRIKNEKLSHHFRNIEIR